MYSFENTIIKIYSLVLSHCLYFIINLHIAVNFIQKYDITCIMYEKIYPINAPQRNICRNKKAAACFKTAAISHISFSHIPFPVRHTAGNRPRYIVLVLIQQPGILGIVNESSLDEGGRHGGTMEDRHLLQFKSNFWIRRT